MDASGAEARVAHTWSWRFSTSCVRTPAHVKSCARCWTSASRATVPLPSEAAGRLGVHPKTLTRAAAAGRVAGARRVGRHWRFDPAELALEPPRGAPAAPDPRSLTFAGSRRSRGRDSDRRFRVASGRLRAAYGTLPWSVRIPRREGGRTESMRFAQDAAAPDRSATPSTKSRSNRHWVGVRDGARALNPRGDGQPALRGERAMSVKPRTRKDGTRSGRSAGGRTAPTDLGCSRSRRMPIRGTARLASEAARSARRPATHGSRRPDTRTVGDRAVGSRTRGHACRSTRERYAEVYGVHIAPWLDDVPLGQFSVRCCPDGRPR